MRNILARLEILLLTINIFGINEKSWNPLLILEQLVCPSLFNSSPDVRTSAVEIIVAMYKIVGEDVRSVDENVENLKPNLL